MSERILACTHAERHDGAQPLHDAPSCPYCGLSLDVVGVDAIVQGGGTVETATALECACGYRFAFNPCASTHRAAAELPGFGDVTAKPAEGRAPWTG